MEPRIQYARASDGVNIAYWTFGDGGIPLVMNSPLLFGHLTRELGVPAIRQWYERLASHRMIVRFDQRGFGLSDRNLDDLGMDVRADDVACVMDKVGVQRVALVGFYGPSQALIRFAARHPDRVERLAVWAGLIRNSSVFASPQFQAILTLAERDWHLFTETFAHQSLGWSRGTMAHEWAEWIRDSVTQQDWLGLARTIAEQDSSKSLEAIPAPTLVLYQPGLYEGDVGLDEARFITARMADARLVQLGERFRLPYLNEEGTRMLEDFLSEGDATTKTSQTRAGVPHGTAIILFADIADSTALTERLGDAAFRAKARDLDAALRTVIRELAGTAIEGKLLGDGVLAVFTSARQAIEAALACATSGDEAALPLHLGLHAGDVIREENNVYGGAVNIASRIAGLSAAGEVLVSETVRSLARTSAGVRFEDRGEQALKGVGEPVRVWAVRPQL